MNIVDTILFQCRINAERPALAKPGSRFGLVSYSQLEYMINNITRTLVPFGFRPGQIVGISVEDKILHVALMLALMRIRVTAVSCQSRDLPTELNARAVITDGAHPASGGEQSIQITPEWVMAKGETRAIAFAANVDDEPCCILRSDSSGALKFVPLSHSQLINRTAQLEYSFGHRWPQCSRLYCSIDLSSEAALRCTIYTLMRGGLVLFFGENIASTVQSINLFGIQKMIVTPQGLEDHLRAYEESGIECNLDHIVLVDPNISNALLERGRARMSTHIFVEFSMPEIGVVASANARTVSSTPGTAGYVVPPAIVEIVDKTGKLVPAGSAGIVRVRSPNMANGYVGASSSAPYFRDGWYCTTHSGHLNEQGLLVIER